MPQQEPSGLHLERIEPQTRQLLYALFASLLLGCELHEIAESVEPKLQSWLTAVHYAIGSERRIVLNQTEYPKYQRKMVIGKWTWLNMMNRLVSPIQLVVWGVISGLLVAAPVVSVPTTTEPPKLDGSLDDPAWETAAVISEFYQREPNPGQPISEKTIVYIAVDRDNIYFGFRCYDNPDQITAKEMARDVSLGQDDRVQVILDTFLDQRNGYWFQIGPRGSIGDALVSENGARFNKQWDGLFEGKAKIHDDGWDAEIAIPFKTMTFRPGQSEWGLKLIRHIKRKEESSYWPEGSLDTYRFQVSDSGIIDGLGDITQGIGLDVRPYGVLGYDQRQEGNSEFVGDAGVDVFYQVTSGIKTALTVNTDFAETEVDSRRINLTRFPLFFPEKRDFFLDGANYFDFGSQTTRLIPFFSRRLGLDEDGNPIPILLGAKVTGQQGPWNIGFLNITDDREGVNRNFTAARVTRNLRGQSSLGMILTRGNALSESQTYLAGVDVKLASSRFLKNKNIALSLFGLKSSTEEVTGGETAFGFQFLYPNDFLNIDLGFHQIGDDFVAGIGFVPRTDIRQSYMDFQVGPRPEKFGIRQLSFGASLDYITDLDNTLLTRNLSLIPLGLRFDTGDTLTARISSRYELLLEEFKIHPDHTIPTGSYAFDSYSVVFQSAQRRNLWLGSQFSWGAFYNGRQRDSGVSLGYKVAVPFYFGAEYERSQVFLPEGDFTANISRFNANILFGPEVTLYNFVQYDNFSKKMGWQSRFYWILKPGNEFIFVWNSSWRDPFESLELRESATRFKINYNYRF